MGEVIPFVHRIGEYVADYSSLTPEQIAVDDGELLELYRNSVPRWPGGSVLGKCGPCESMTLTTADLPAWPAVPWLSGPGGIDDLEWE